MQKSVISILKTALSDLQGAWENLREAVAGAPPFPECERLLFHIDEAMSWENVRNLKHMDKMLLLIQNLAIQAKAPDEVLEWVETVRDNFNEVLAAIEEGDV